MSRERQSSFRAAWNAAKRLRFTLGFLAVMALANLTAGSLAGDLPQDALAEWGISLADLERGELFRLITGTFLSHDQDMFVRQVAFAGAVIGWTEWQRGALRTGALFFFFDLTGTLVLLALIGRIAPLADASDVGMSIGGFGLIGLALAGRRHGLFLFATVLAAIGVKYLFWPDPLADAGHGLALALGLVAGHVPWRCRQRFRRRFRRPSDVEVHHAR